MKNVKWTQAEEQIIKEKYHNTPFSELLHLLPKRTKMGIKLRAQILGVIREPKCRSGEFRKTKYKRDRNFFFEPNLLNSYWAGFIAADGGIDTPHNRLYIKLSSLDHDHLVQFAQDVNFNGPIKRFWETTDKARSEFSKIVVDSVGQWILDLEKHYNIHQNKTKDLQGPNLDQASDLALAYIAGYIDGDGSILTPVITVKGNKYRIIYIALTGTNTILNWVNDVIELQYPVTTTRKTNVKACDNTRIVDRLSIGGARALEVIYRIKAMDLPLLSRKWRKVDNLVLGRI